MAYTSCSHNDTGYLELFIGPMFSGKTSKLLEIYKQYKFCSIPIAVINHSADVRYHESHLSTHDKIMIPCIQSTELLPLCNHIREENDTHVSVNDAKVILINEGQFFEDLYEFVVEMLTHHKKIYVAGLDGDFLRNKFGRLLDLIPLSDKTTKLHSLCANCKDGTLGIFSKRLTMDKQQMLIGFDNYIPVCRQCYENDCIINM
jgi:thymidine kinase